MDLLTQWCHPSTNRTASAGYCGVPLWLQNSDLRQFEKSSKPKPSTLWSNQPTLYLEAAQFRYLQQAIMNIMLPEYQTLIGQPSSLDFPEEKWSILDGLGGITIYGQYHSLSNHDFSAHFPPKATHLHLLSSWTAAICRGCLKDKNGILTKVIDQS